jgi:UDP-glucose 4-epimerase
MVVPRFVRQALRGEPLSVYGDGKQTRCFSDVADVIEGLYRLVQQPQATGQVFNIGATQEIAIVELAERIISLTASSSQIQFIPYSEAYAPGFDDMRRRVPSIEKISQLTGFQPRYSLDETLGRVIAYEKME